MIFARLLNAYALIIMFAQLQKNAVKRHCRRKMLPTPCVS